MWKRDARGRPRQDHPAARGPLFHGRHDRTCSYRQAQSFCDQLDAPVKGFYTFSESAHSPVFEEPAHARLLLMTDVLHSTAEHCDTATTTPVTD